jgi:Glyoxalase/Bleomycin resistance protein/Dioxygenase superfamily
LSSALRNPFFHVGFIVSDLDAAMEEFQAALGIEWRAPIDAIVPLLGPGRVVEAEVYSVSSEGGSPAIELVQSVPGTPLAGDGGVSFHHLGFWTDRLADSSRDLGAHGWPCAATAASPESNPNRFTLQQSRHALYVELFDTASPRHADLLPKPRIAKDTTLNTSREPKPRHR